MKKIKSKVLIVGGSGFLGSEILNQFSKIFDLISISRFKPINNNILWIPTNELFFDKGKNKILNLRPDKIIYTTFIAHQKYSLSLSFKEECEKINFQLLKIIIDISLKIKCNKFIYISSAGIYGNTSSNENPIKENSKIVPQSDYAKMKIKCEKYLKSKLRNSEVKYTILRPCLIYGRKIKGNLFLLKKIIDTRIPLPFKYLNNKRSFLSIDNFISVIKECLNNPAADNETFLVSDKEQISLFSLVSIVSSVRFKNNFFYLLPGFLLLIFKNTFFIKKYHNHLYSDLVIDSSYIRNKLSWDQPICQSISMLNSFYIDD